MHTVDKSLRCLRHTATLASVGLRIVNDHLLKAITPCWLTGKLLEVRPSDWTHGIRTLSYVQRGAKHVRTS